MPRGDRTGPAGMGPLTGRGAGYCAGSGIPGFNQGGWGGFGGRGLGRGPGGGAGGRGFCRWFFGAGLPAWMGYGTAGGASPEPELERHTLQNQADMLQSQLDRIKKRLQEMGTAAPSE